MITDKDKCVFEIIKQNPDISINSNLWTVGLLELSLLSNNAKIILEKAPSEVLNSISFLNKALLVEKSYKTLEMLCPMLSDTTLNNDTFMKSICEKYGVLSVLKCLPQRKKDDVNYFLQLVDETIPVSKNVAQLLEKDPNNIGILFNKFPNECLLTNNQKLFWTLTQEQIDQYLKSKRLNERSLDYIPLKFFNDENVQCIMEEVPNCYSKLPVEYQEKKHSICRFLESLEGEDEEAEITEDTIVRNLGDRNIYLSMGRILGNCIVSKKFTAKEFLEEYKGVVSKGVLKALLNDEEFKKILEKAMDNSKIDWKKYEEANDLTNLVRYVLLNEDLKVKSPKKLNKI